MDLIPLSQHSSPIAAASSGSACPMTVIACRGPRVIAHPRAPTNPDVPNAGIRSLILRRVLSILIPSCLSCRPSSASRQQLHRSTMRLLSLLEAERKYGAIGYENLRQLPKRSLRAEKKCAPRVRRRRSRPIVAGRRSSFSGVQMTQVS